MYPCSNIEPGGLGGHKESEAGKVLRLDWLGEHVEMRALVLQPPMPITGDISNNIDKIEVKSYERTT